MTLRPAKTQISLGIRPVWSEFSLCAQWVAKDPSFLHEDSEDADQTGRMPRMIWVFGGRTCHFVGFVMRQLNCHQMPTFSVFLINRTVLCWTKWNDPTHEIIVLFVLRKPILQTRMRSYLVGIDVWFFVGTIVFFHTSCVRTTKALVRLRGCTGLPEPSLVA